MDERMPAPNALGCPPSSTTPNSTVYLQGRGAVGWLVA